MSEDNRFNCVGCGFQSNRRGISYDQLGYAVCPVCGEQHRPF